MFLLIIVNLYTEPYFHSLFSKVFYVYNLYEIVEMNNYVPFSLD